MIGLALLIMSGQAGQVQPVENKSPAEQQRPAIEAVVIHPPVAAMFTCSDHSAEESLGLETRLEPTAALWTVSPVPANREGFCAHTARMGSEMTTGSAGG